MVYRGTYVGRYGGDKNTKYPISNCHFIAARQAVSRPARQKSKKADPEVSKRSVPVQYNFRFRENRGARLLPTVLLVDLYRTPTL